MPYVMSFFQVALHSFYSDVCHRLWTLWAHSSKALSRTRAVLTSSVCVQQITFFSRGRFVPSQCTSEQGMCTPGCQDVCLLVPPQRISALNSSCLMLFLLSLQLTDACRFAFCGQTCKQLLKVQIDSIEAARLGDCLL